MLKKFVIKRIKIKGGCQSESKVITHNSKSDWPLAGLSSNSARRYFGKQLFGKQFFSKQFFGKQLFGKAVI